MPPDEISAQSTSRIRPGQVWKRSNDGSRVRVQGFSKTDRGWVMVREIGGDRARSSYPPTPFLNGGFVLIEEGVIEHWRIYVATDSEGDRLAVRQPDAVEAERRGLEAVDVVPAAIYREAVAENERLLAEVATLKDWATWGGYDGSES